MIATFEGLAVFLLFLPGFISQRIIEILSPKKSRDWFGRLVSSGVLSLLIYGFYIVAIASWSGLPQVPAEIVSPEQTVVSTYPEGQTTADGTVQSLQTIWRVRFNYQVCGIIIGISIVLGLAIGSSMDRGTFYAALRGTYIPIPKDDDRSLRALLFRILKWFLRFTSSTGRDTAWEDALHVRRSHFVKVTLRNGRTIIGRYLCYSDNPRVQDLWIIKPEQSLLPGHSPEVLVAEAGSTEYRPVLSSSGILITDSAEIETVEFIGDIAVDSEHGKRKGTARRTHKGRWWQKSRRDSA